MSLIHTQYALFPQYAFYTEIMRIAVFDRYPKVQYIAYNVLNNTANAGRIVSKPKRQEDSSCVFACRFCRGTCHRRGTTGKRKCAEIASAQVRKKKFYKKSSGRCGVRTVKGEASSRSCMPQSECGAGHAGQAYHRSAAGRITGHWRSLPQPSSAAWCPPPLHWSRAYSPHVASY